MHLPPESHAIRHVELTHSYVSHATTPAASLKTAPAGGTLKAGSTEYYTERALTYGVQRRQASADPGVGGRRRCAPGAADDGGVEGAGHGRGGDAVAAAREAGEAARVHVRAVRARPQAAAGDAPLRLPPQPGLPPVRRLRLRRRRRPPHRCAAAPAVVTVHFARKKI